MNPVLPAAIAALLVAPLVFQAGASAASGRTGIYFPLFTPPGPMWDDMLKYRKEHPSLPWIAVADPHHGPGQQFDPSYAQNIARLQAQNVTVLGYVSTLWGARPADAIKGDIRNYHDWYHVDGIMLDEMVSNPGLEGHYSGLARYVKSLGMGPVIGNVGTNIAPSYIGTVDSIGTVEGDGIPPVSWLKGWHASYDKSNFLYITYSQGWIDRDYVAESAKYAGSIYITDDSMPFPYDTFPSYFDELVSALDPQGQDSLRNLSVKAFDLLGNSIEGTAVSIDAGNSLHTPLTQVAERGSAHTVTATGNQTYIFDHWDDGSTSPSRALALDSSQVLRAYYRTPSTSSLHSSIVFNALTLQGGQLHMGAAVSLDGSQVKSGFAPLVFAGQDKTYTVTAADNFGKLVFDHWENGSTDITRQVSLQGGNAYLTAYYRVQDLPAASVTVDAYTLDGTEVRGLWATISSQGGDTPFTRMASAGSTYAVTATDGSIYVFDHWQDGSTDRTTTVVPSSDATLTAYYRTPPATLAVGSADLSGNSLEGMYATISAMDGKAQGGFTNMTYAGSLGSAYTVSASDYRGMVFDHWQDGVKDRTRNVMLTADTELTAYYRMGGAQRGLTPATFASPLGPPALLTVSAESLNGRPLNMWSIANPEDDGSYAVTVHNYRGYTFSHWEDGSTNATRIVPAGGSAVTAFFGD